MMLRRFTELSPEVTSAVIAFLWRLIEKCNLEPMLYQLQFLQTFCEVLEHPASATPRHAELASSCRKLTRRFFRAAKHNPAIFVEALFWTRPTDCATIMEGYEGFVDPKRKKEAAARKPSFAKSQHKKPQQTPLSPRSTGRAPRHLVP